MRKMFLNLHIYQLAKDIFAMFFLFVCFKNKFIPTPGHQK